MSRGQRAAPDRGSEEALVEVSVEATPTSGEAITGCFLLGQDGEIRYYTPTTAKILGCGTAELLGRNFLEQLAPGQGTSWEQLFTKFPDFWTPIPLMLRRSDGSLIQGDVRAHILETAPQRKYWLMLSASLPERRTEPRMALPSLAEDHAETTPHAMGDAVVIIDNQEGILFLNPEAEALTGWTCREAYARPMERILRFDGGQEHPFRRVLRERIPLVLSTPLLLQAGPGTQTPILGEFSPIFDARGELKSVVAVFHDAQARQQARRNLDQEGEWLKLAAEAAQMGTFVFEWVDRKIHISPEFQQMWGFDQDVITPEQVKAAFLPEGIRIFEERILAAMIPEGSRTFDFETQFHHSDGSLHWIQWKGRVAFQDDGMGMGLRPAQAFGIILDITERVKAREDQDLSRRKMQEALESIRDDFYVLDREWRFVYVNRPFAGRINRAPEDILGRSIWELLPKYLGTEFERNLRAAMLTRDECRFEVQGLYTIRHYEVLASPSMEGLTLISRDITTRKSAEEQLRLQAKLLDLLNEAVMVTDPEQRARSWNRGAEVLFGYPAEEALGRDTEELLHPILPPPGREAALARLEAEGRLQIEMVVHRKDGQPVEVLTSTSILKDGEGRPAGMLTIAHDITEKNRRERELQSLNRTLRALSDSRKALMHASQSTPEDFLAEICRIVTEDCGYHLIWIGLKEEDEARTVRPVAHAGFGEGFLQGLGITWADVPLGQGPTGTAIRTGAPSLCRDTLADPRFEPWREKARAHGYRSVLSLPLLSGSQALGALTIYSLPPESFPEAEVSLLQELAADVAHGIVVGQLRAEQARADEERTRLLQEVQRDEALLEGVFAAQQDAVLVYDDFAVRRANPAFREAYGFDPVGLTPGELLRRLDCRWPDDQRLALGDDLEALPQGAPLVVRMGDGSEAFMEITRSALDTMNDIGGVVSVWHDATGRVRARQALEQAWGQAEREKQLLETILEVLPVGAAILDHKGGILRFNRSFDEIWGAPRPTTQSEMDYVHYQAWWPSSGHRLETREWAGSLALRSGRVITGQTIRIQRFDGTEAYILNSAAPVLDGEGTITGVVVAIQDITRLVKAEQALRDLNETLEQRVAERTEESRHLADQLRALASELARAEQRERKRLASILHDHLQQLLVAAQLRLDLIRRSAPRDREVRISAVESILDEAIQTSRSLAVELSPPVLHQAGLVPALGWLAERVKEKHLFEVRLEADPAAEPASEPIRLFLFEAARELLLNCIKYSSAPGATVSLTRAPDEQLRLVVSDRGKGFDLHGLSAPSDTGLGLFGIQQRLAHLGGALEIASSPGNGTTVTMLAPSGGEARGTVGSAGPRPQALSRPHPRIRILLVDDHAIVRQGIANLLRLESGLEIVSEAEDGPRALALADELEPDVAVVDVSLPGMGGVELTRLLRENHPALHVIGLSMHDEPSVALAMRQAGASDYLTKGGPSRTLIAAIRSCIDFEEPEGSAY